MSRIFISPDLCKENSIVCARRIYRSHGYGIRFCWRTFHFNSNLWSQPVVIIRIWVATQILIITIYRHSFCLTWSDWKFAWWTCLIFFWLCHRFSYPTPAKMLFYFKNCSDLLWEKIVFVIEKILLKFEAEGQEFAKFLRSLKQFIQTVKGQNNFW